MRFWLFTMLIKIADTAPLTESFIKPSKFRLTDLLAEKV